MLNQEKLFNEIVGLKGNIQSMARIVQNEGVEISDNEFNEWNEEVNNLIITINKLKLDVLDFYGKR